MSDARTSKGIQLAAARGRRDHSNRRQERVAIALLLTLLLALLGVSPTAGHDLEH
jgi:hypothetical protein